MSVEHRAKFRNDRGVPEIRIGVGQFACIGASPPHDHPHIYLELAPGDALLCPYCGTRFCFDARLGPRESDPPDAFVDDAAFF